MSNINTSATLKQSTKPEAELQRDLDLAARRAGNAKMVELYIPEAYRGAFGDPLEFSVNGVSVKVPIGKKIMVPEPHFKHAQRLMKGAVINKSQRRLTPEEIYND